MKKNWIVIGVDVSKLTLDFHHFESNSHAVFKNNSEGFLALQKWIKGLKLKLEEILLVLEFTGGYEYRLTSFCFSKNISHVRVPGMAIKRSQGISRGKSDKVDAKRIAIYGKEKLETLTPDTPLDPVLFTLKDLLSFRKKLVRENASYQSSMGERKHMYGYDDKEYIVKSYIKRIEANKKEINLIDKKMQMEIKKSPKISINYNLVESVKGIGPVNAIMTIVLTENFTSFKDARAYGVYVGVIPFENTSGTSIKGKKTTSHIAHKEAKQELNQAAKSAIQHDKELKAYAERKMENKVYGIVLNNVMFKLVQRMFAVVKRGEKYVENYKRAC
jgi:transposase